MSDELITVDVADLRGDAKLWNTAAGDLQKAIACGQAQDLPNEAFMMAGISVAAGYRALASQLLDRMTAGHAQLSGLSAALVEIAEEFEQYELDTMAAVEGLGDQLGEDFDV
ncbi:hypothetical protein AB0N73_07755 [Microbacterium sp. NPDC089189]|uniref:hypothetical protein n=1 Tax=Microbacterium sp. NPDC089189 TaxID=3154972 RepID=UPI00342D5D11